MIDIRQWWHPVIYVVVEPAEIVFRHVQTGRTVTERPFVARVSKGSIAGGCLAIGRDAELLKFEQNVILTNPFAHPRLVISDFAAAEFIFQHLARRLFRFRLQITAPIVVVHPIVDPAGGFTQMEIRALRELAHVIGASTVILWIGRTPSDKELLTLEFHSDGRFLHA